MEALAEELGVKIGTSIFAELGEGTKHPKLKAEIDELIGCFVSKAERLRLMHGEVSHGLDVDAGLWCGSGVKMVSVNEDGDIYPCHMLHRPEFLVGNLLKTPDLRRMISSSSIIRSFRERTVEARKCHGCDVEYFCKGGCLAYAMTQSDSDKAWREKDPYCSLHQEVLSRQIWE